jgi:hypothetical protein
MFFVTNNIGIISKSINGSQSRMTQTKMPQARGVGEPDVRDGAAGWWWDGVNVTGTIAAQDHTSGLDILHRKTKGIKFYGAIIVFVNGRTKARLRIKERTIRT